MVTGQSFVSKETAGTRFPKQLLRAAGLPGGGQQFIPADRKTGMPPIYGGLNDDEAVFRTIISIDHVEEALEGGSSGHSHPQRRGGRLNQLHLAQAEISMREAALAKIAGTTYGERRGGLCGTSAPITEGPWAFCRERPYYDSNPGHARLVVFRYDTWRVKLPARRRSFESGVLQFA